MREVILSYNIYLLRHAWSRVVDFYILQEIFKDDDTEEYICLIGDAHRQNIENYISNTFKVKAEHQESKDNKCILINKMNHGTYINHLIAKSMLDMHIESSTE